MTRATTATSETGCGDDLVAGGVQRDGDAGPVRLDIPTGRQPGHRQPFPPPAHQLPAAPAERADALLKSGFKGLRRVTICPRRIGQIVAADLVILTMHGGPWRENLSPTGPLRVFVTNRGILDEASCGAMLRSHVRPHE